MVLNVKPQGSLEGSCPKPYIQDRPAIGAVSFDDFYVFWAAVRIGSKHLRRSEIREVEQNLVRTLLDDAKVSCRSMEGFVYSFESALEITKDGLGKPLLWVNGDAGPSVSFASTDDCIMAALCRQDRSCGVDCASAKEFDHRYPLQRIFSATEMAIMRDVTGLRSTENLAALIWSLKESAVKALGCGFHLVDPLELRVVGLDIRSSMLRSEVHVFIEKSVGFGGLNSQNHVIPVRSFMSDGEWISVALTNTHWPSP